MRAVASQRMSEMKRNVMMIALVIVMMMRIAVGNSEQIHFCALLFGIPLFTNYLLRCFIGN